MIDSKIKISFVVPVYNTALFLEKCIDSILNIKFSIFIKAEQHIGCSLRGAQFKMQKKLYQ